MGKMLAHPALDGNSLFSFFIIETDSAIEKCAAIFEASVSREYMALGDIYAGRVTNDLEWRSGLAQKFIEDYRKSKNAVCYVGIRARTTDEVVGFLIVDIDAEKCLAELYDIIVREDFRDKGVGAIALRWVEAELRLNGVRRIALESGAGNGKAHCFFERQGFRKLAVEFIKEIQ